MGAKQIASRNAFVVKVNSDAFDAALTSLASFGKVEKLPGFELLLLQVAEAYPDSKVGSERILNCLESVEWVAPVLLDDQSHPHFPTGEIMVRFNHIPSEAELEQFSKAHGLRLRRRNEFMPEQACFTPAVPYRAYLPELLESLDGEKGVASAWANTLSRFKRV